MHWPSGGLPSTTVGVHPSHSAPDTARVTKDPDAVRTLVSSPSATPNFCGSGPFKVYTISSDAASVAAAVFAAREPRGTVRIENYHYERRTTGTGKHRSTTTRRGER